MFSLNYKIIIYLIVTSISIFFYFNNIPFSKLPKNYGDIISIFRIIYYSLFIFYAFKLTKLSRLMYEKNEKEFFLIRNILIIVSLLIVLGIFTKFFIIIHHIFFLLLFREKRCKFYGIEQIYLQIIGIFFIFSNSSKINSLDAYFENQYLLGDFYSVYPLNFLTISISLCLFSGFYEKINSSIWISGKDMHTYFIY